MSDKDQSSSLKRILKVSICVIIFLLTTIVLQILNSTTPHRTISMPEVMPKFVVDRQWQKARLFNNFTTAVSRPTIVPSVFYSTTKHQTSSMPEVTPVLPQHCQLVFDRQRQKARRINVTTPHWLERMNGTSSKALNSTELTDSNLFLMTMNNGGRLGNQMLSYAALFGIAWRHRRIPLWQKNRMQLQTFFNTSFRQGTFKVCHKIKNI